MTTLSCPACNTINPTTASTCSHCGASLTEAIILQQAQRLKEAGDRVTSIPKPMPAMRSSNGCGTILLDYRPMGDGTYEAARWFTLAYLPILPLTSLIVKPIKHELGIQQETHHYALIGPGKLSPVRILRTYLLSLLAVVPVVAAFGGMNAVNRVVGSGWGMGVTLAACGWCVFMLSRVSNSGQAYRGTDS